MTASQSLAHPWLRRKLQKKPVPPKILTPSELDIAKDNLRCFVERWSEHPNSPYLFDTSYHTISPCPSATHVPGARSPAPSLSANSPSPCGSISSIPDECELPSIHPPPEPAPAHNKFFLDRLNLFDRRASDSTCFVRHNNDSVSRINLAEEIKKLSDKLLKFNYSTDSLNNNDKEETYYFTSVSSKSSVFDKDPHFRRKFKLTNHNHDVPLTAWARDDSSSTLSSCSSQSGPQSLGTSPEPPDMTKDLLEMLDKFEGLGKIGVHDHRKSLSMEWSDAQTLSQRTMRSLSNYIQSSRGSVVEQKKSRFSAQKS